MATLSAKDAFDRREATRRVSLLLVQSGLTARQFAQKLSTPAGSLTNWLRGDCNPPGCLLVLVDILEKFPEVREYLGMEKAV